MRAIGVALVAFGVVGCATVTKGTNQAVAITTPGVPGAVCVAPTVNGPQTVTTPGHLVLAKSSAAIPIKCSKECYHDGAGLISSSIEPMTAGNVLIGGVVGIGVDAVSGALNKYPDEISIDLVPIPGCGQQRRR